MFSVIAQFVWSLLKKHHVATRNARHSIVSTYGVHISSTHRTPFVLTFSSHGANVLGPVLFSSESSSFKSYLTFSMGRLHDRLVHQGKHLLRRLRVYKTIWVSTQACKCMCEDVSDKVRYGARISTIDGREWEGREFRRNKKVSKTRGELSNKLLLRLDKYKII